MPIDGLSAINAAGGWIHGRAVVSSFFCRTDIGLLGARRLTPFYKGLGTITGLRPAGERAGAEDDAGRRCFIDEGFGRHCLPESRWRPLVGRHQRDMADVETHEPAVCGYVGGLSPSGGY